MTDLTDKTIHVIDPRHPDLTFCKQPKDNVHNAVLMRELQEQWWQCFDCRVGADKLFMAILDRDLRDCCNYAAIMFDDPGDLGGAMFELGPADIIRWEWERFFGNPAKQ